MTARILVAEDDRGQAEVIRRYLAREGHRVAVVHDGRAAIESVRRHRPDLLVLDLVLPAVSGLEVCRVVRAEHDVAVVMLTARAGEDDLLLGFSLGADDYVTKPFSPPELLARVQAVLRRSARSTGHQPEQVRIGRLLIDAARHEVRVDGTAVATTPAEFALLSSLGAAPGRAFTRQMLLERTGRFDRSVTARAVDMHVMNLRRKIEPDPTRPRYLLTVTGVGYKLADPADEEAGGAP
ncbi:response regulator transcription factor [Jiangella asiatica]|uniref:Response regulator transcription factor n=1 Tax=Jiangella asiatica TaxID=2530372 RepID=A0A4V2Z2A7_9ACTN|nr:response regulator transcription factor [Jiangella asiatica]TDE08118.1 response regulator transcription factor [Jiangella asiatica]